jgi:hypothetical protein
VGGAVRLTRIPDKKSIFLKQISFQNTLKLKIYYAKGTLRIEVVFGKNIFIIVFSAFI